MFSLNAKHLKHNCKRKVILKNMFSIYCCSTGTLSRETCNIHVLKKLSALFESWKLSIVSWVWLILLDHITSYFLKVKCQGKTTLGVKVNLLQLTRHQFLTSIHNQYFCSVFILFSQGNNANFYCSTIKVHSRRKTNKFCKYLVL